MQIHRVSVLLLTPRPPLLVNSEQVGFEWKVQRSEFTRRGGAKSTFENPEVIFPEILRLFLGASVLERSDRGTPRGFLDLGWVNGKLSAAGVVSSTVFQIATIASSCPAYLSNRFHPHLTPD